MAVPGPRPTGGLIPHAGVDLPTTAEQQIRQQIHAATLEAVVYSADGAISVANQLAILTKGSAAAMTLAAPVAGDDDGKLIEITAGSDFAHVVTLPSGVLLDGSTGAKVTWTSAAFKGSSLRLRAYNAKWYVISKNLGTIA